MDKFAVACIILLPFLVLYSVIGGVVELYCAMKCKQRDKPDLDEEIAANAGKTYQDVTALRDPLMGLGFEGGIDA